jgi:hypothetical protein
LVAACWFVGWTTVGAIVGRLLETPGYYTVMGLLFAFATIFAWPFVLPNRLQDWMDE